MLTPAHRSLLLLALTLVLAAPAGAAEVARTDGVTLDARDDRRAGGFCVQVSTGEHAFGGSAGTCGRAPWRPRRSMLVTMVADGRLFMAGAIPAGVARAEAELVDGRRIAVETVAGPRYRGRHSGRLRFFLAALPLADRRDERAGGLLAVRFHGADGALLGSAGGAYDGTLIGRGRVLLRERREGRSIIVAAETRRRVVPTPLELDRVEDLTCLVVRTRDNSRSDSSSSACHEPGPNRPSLLVFPESGCNGVRTVISGFVGDAVTAVRLRLGSGRVREVPTRTLRDPQGGEHRYLAVAVPRGEAVRSIGAVGARARYELAEPPSGLPCPATGGFYAFSFMLGLEDAGAARPPGGDEQVAAEAGGHRLLVRDAEAGRLCAGLGRLLEDGSDCGLPAVNGEDAVGRARSGVVAAVLPAEVARVRLPGGREVPTVAGGYTGRYAGRVRFLLAKAPTSFTDRFRLLDSSGAVIGPLPVFDPAVLRETPKAGPVRLASGRGWRLSAARFHFGACVYLALRGEDEQCLADAPDEGAMAAVGCAPRVAVLAGTLTGRRVSAVRAVLRGGRTVRARVVRAPRRFGGDRVWVLALPRRARVVALRFDARRVAFSLLPASRQCGYRVYAPGLGSAEPQLERRAP